MLKPLSILFTATVLALGSLSQAGAQECPEGTSATSLKGKIYNNGVAANETLGVAHLTLGQREKMKCAVHGVGGVTPAGEIDFFHTIVCDDSVEVLNPYIGQVETVHSQLTLHTTGTADFELCIPGVPAAGTHGTFDETSVAVPGTGRGIFQGVTVGALEVQGTTNCLFSIDMAFAGSACLPE